MSTYSAAPVARKRYRCEDYRSTHFIEPGQQHVRAVCFPGDVNSSDRPWVMRVCVPCWRRYDSSKPLAGRERAS